MPTAHIASQASLSPTGLHAVRPDWAIFDRYWQQSFTKVAQIYCLTFYAN